MGEKEGMNNLSSLASKVVDLSQKQIKTTPLRKVDHVTVAKAERSYTVIPARAIRDPRINKTAAYVVLSAMCQYTNRMGETYVGQQRLADDLQVSHQAISRQLKILIDLGYIERLQKGNKDYSAKHRVIFDTKLTGEDVRANIPARLREDNNQPVPLSKEESAERIKKVKELLKKGSSTQHQKLNDDGISIQPVGCIEIQSQRNIEGGSIQPGGGFNATSDVARKVRESNIKEGAFERWMEK